MRFLYISFIVLLLATSCVNEDNSGMTREEILAFHESLLTIDSHTDTPLQLTREDFDFSLKHDPVMTGSKMDLPRLKEGMLDAVYMAVFLGQKERTDEGNQVACNKAMQIFDSIYSLASRYPDKLGVVTNEKEFRKNAGKGKHSFFIGIENGYAIGNNIDLIDTFYNMGARYITLCHTKNNDICDSSNDTTEHDGLSSFGKEVVKRMNRVGMMIDVSHISDKAFYDVISLSEKPVIASHSCARAICDNPRNLDDNMLKMLAENGGVVQMCILSDYVETPEAFPERDSAKNAVREKHGNYYSLSDSGKVAFLDDWFAVDRIFPEKLSTVSRVVDHIDHMVQVAGIDHVGIGTDFDGGGGVEDCFDVAGLPNITAELLKRGYSRKDIRKIWGENLLRVMKKNGI